MLQLHNTTPFAADIVLLPNEQGVDTLYIMSKASFDVASELTLSDLQRPLNLKDEYRGVPQNSSLQQVGDYHLTKTATDIIVVGDSVAPGDGPITQCDVDIQVGPVAKTLRVFGDRVWDSGRISAPRPFVSLPLIYEHAFGGAQIGEDGAVLAADMRNPAGLGWVNEPNSAKLDGVRLPNIEDPRQLIAAPGDQPDPAGCGAIAPFWQGRSRYAGTYDAAWQSSRAPFLPQDFDPSFFQVASPGLICTSYLQGGEPVRITNMSDSGDWSFSLPWVELVGHVQWRGQHHRVQLALETVELAPTQSRLTMTWRGALPVNQHALKIEAVTLKLQRTAAAQGM